MKYRLLLIAFLLFLRVVFNVLSCLDYRNGVELSIKGNVSHVEQNATKCIIFMGRYFVEIEKWCDFSRGDKISLIGKYNRRLIDTFYGKINLSVAVIDKFKIEGKKTTESSDLMAFFGRFRENIATIYYRYLPNKEAALVAGIVLGDKKGISGDLYKQMVNSGTIHIAVASGYNLMLIGGTTMSILFWIVKRKRATILAILVMLFYTLMAGGEPPVTRALIMASMVFIGLSMGRSQMSWWALLLTAWAMLMFDISLIASISFQLSVMASIGLMIVEPWIKRNIDTLNSRLLRIFSEIGVTTTISTMMVTAPVIWWHFGRFSSMALISNTLVLPMVPLLMILGAMMIVLGGIVSLPTYVVSHLMIIIIGVFGK